MIEYKRMLLQEMAKAIQNTKDHVTACALLFAFKLANAIPDDSEYQIVRCKDCNKGREKAKGSKVPFVWCDKWSNIMRESDFCSYGRKRLE